VALDYYPNATVAEYGTIIDNDKAARVHKIKAELYLRGPVSASINANPLVKFAGGKIFDDEEAPKNPDHVVSIVGWGVEGKKEGKSKKEGKKEFWIVRNSWGQYWGEGGFFRVATGTNMLGLENNVAWATVGTYTTKNVPCSEDGKTCGGEVNGIHGEHVMKFEGQEYVDPSNYLFAKE